MRAHGFLLPRRRLGADEGGSAVVEFALIVPVLIFLLMAIFQIGLVFTAGQVLEDATTEAARTIRTGQVQKAGTAQSVFRDNFCSRVKVFLSCSSGNLLIDIKALPSSGSVDLSWPINLDGSFAGTGSYAPGAKEETVLVRVFYQYPVWIPFVGESMTNLPNGKRLLAASAAFRNEPF